MDILRGALTNLGKYNEGGLDYVWVSFPCDEDDFQDSLKKVGIGEDRGDGSVYEEWFFSDWDTDYSGLDLDGLGEYMSLDEVNEYAEALENIVDEGTEEEFRAAMEYSGDFHDALNLVETGSVTKISDESMSNRMDEAIGAYYMDSMGFNAMSNIEEYFDYEAYGQDIRIEYYPVKAGDPETLRPQKSTGVGINVPLMKKLVVQSWISSVGMASVKRIWNATSIMKHLVVIFRWIWHLSRRMTVSLKSVETK